MSVKKCRHCDITFSHPDDCPVPHDRCERCHEKFKFYVGLSTSALQYDPVTLPAHYQSDDVIECIDAIRAALGPADVERLVLSGMTRELDSSQEEFERLDKKEFGSEEEEVRWALRGRKELREQVAVATQEFYRAAEALAPGQRGHKDLMTDLDDIIASAKRAKELEQ